MGQRKKLILNALQLRPQLILQGRYELHLLLGVQNQVRMSWEAEKHQSKEHGLWSHAT